MAYWPVLDNDMSVPFCFGSESAIYTTNCSKKGPPPLIFVRKRGELCMCGLAFVQLVPNPGKKFDINREGYTIAQIKLDSIMMIFL